jgi:hypothetical protein
MRTRVVALAVVLFASAGPALGQFTVQPMRLDLQVTPGKILPQSITIRNTDPNQAHTITLTVVDVTQDRNAEWMVVEPNSTAKTLKSGSLKDSIRIRPTSVTLEPGVSAPVEVLIRVPRGTRGFSCAGILASLGTMQVNDIPVRLRFMVPVILQIAGRSPRHRVYPVDLGMQFIEAGQRGLGSAPTTLLSMDIENTGPTFPRTRPIARVWSWAKGHWRIVTTTGFQDMSNDVGIIPGAKVTVRTDLNKSLPPGKYKIAGELYVDGKRTKRITKEIDFAGDPDITTVAADQALDLDPSELVIESLPGATRTTMMKVQNGSDETLKVQAVLGVPRDLAGKIIGNVKGVDMDCTPWITVEPRKFTLAGEGATQVVRITTSMPETAVTCPNYYTNLDFWSFYPDGQGAGSTRAKLAVTNLRQRGNVVPQASADSLSPYLLTGSKYQIAARFSNPSLAHYPPIECKAAITELTSNIPRISTVLKSDMKGYMLPGEERNFTGILDLSPLDADEYRLSVALQYDEGLPRAQKQTAVRVTIEGGERVLETIGTQEDLQQILEVKW